MDTKKYEVFEKTVELSSLTKAAQELGLTQSGVSHMLASMEAELQLPLLKRTRTGARLTPEGEQVMPYIHEIVRQERLLRQAAAGLHTLVTGKIRIGTFTSVATHWLPAMMMQFQKEHPQVDFQLFNGDYHDIDTWLGNGSVDLAFTTLPARPGCRCTPLYEDALAAVLPKNQPACQNIRSAVSRNWQRSRLSRFWNPPTTMCAARSAPSGSSRTSGSRRRMTMPSLPWFGKGLA